MIHGKNRIGSELSGNGEEVIQAFNPATLAKLEGYFYCATPTETENAIQKAKKAFASYQKVSGKDKATFLNAIADEIENLGDELIERACAESGLPKGRITGERGRTTGQLRLFAKLVEEGSWVDAVVDTANPNRIPVPKPDLRKMAFPVGPVVVFTASNFPLAFSTSGGDTASALASGCPVIVKAHESHLGTNQLVADAIIKAAQKTNMPDGVFSSLTGKGFKLGTDLVKHPDVKSVAFTGSFRGGKALYDTALEREEPIPVFAEMGSINPVFIFEDKLQKDASAAAELFAGSITLGAGQFCTNPGLIIAPKGEGLNNFTSSLAKAFENKVPEVMLNPGIHENYRKNRDEITGNEGVSIIAESKEEAADLKGKPVAALVDAEQFISNPNLAEEVFGPFSLIVAYESTVELEKIIGSLKGQLTASVIGTDKDVSENIEVIGKLKEKVGRLIFNAAPTGVEVGYGMQHGGPFPATTDGRFTSVGTDAIKRFVRPVAFQDAPQEFLPSELKDGNPLNIWRKVNGELEK
jgi:alpha-ketoglutaric semialdehyde dehydrogenase